MSASLVGSEMCIRDSFGALPTRLCGRAARETAWSGPPAGYKSFGGLLSGCLLYTSDAADDM
eukprot:2925778-Alexandrium_andersonii.AAC.1